jgi:predicted Zn-dependent protease
VGWRWRWIVRLVRATNGDRKGALQILDEKVNASRYVCSYELATAYVSLGDNDAAFRYLNNGLRQRADCMVWLRAEPWMKPLQRDPRFAQLTREIGLR